MALTDKELLAVIDSLEGDIDEDSSGSTASSSRASLMEAYLGEPYGTEREGHSKVVTREVYQAIENYSADIAEIFISDDETVRFEPVGPDDIQTAQQETDYVNYIFHRKNDGFTTILSSLKDGLMQRRGVIKRYWEEQDEVTTNDFENISEDALLVLESDPEVEILEAEEVIDELTGITYFNGKLSRTRTQGQIVVEAVPPEEFKMTNGAKCVEDARLVRQKRKVSMSDLRQMGYSKKKLDQIGSSNAADTTDAPEAMARSFDYPVFSSSTLQDGQQRPITEYEITEAYLKVDKDEDGIAELRKVVFIGKTILEDDEVDEVPFEIWSPIIIPHKAEGLSIADAAYANQEINTTLWRNQLDNQYNLNNSRPIVTEGQVNLDSLSNSYPGKPIIVKTQNALGWQGPQAFAQQTLTMMDKNEQMLEKDVGSSDNTLDPNILNGNTAAGAVSQVLSKRQARMRLVSRIYGEFLKRVFMGVHELVVKYAEDKEVFRLRNDFVEVDPRAWHSRKDVSVMVGLGNGNKNEQLFHLQQAFAAQQAIIAGGGLGTLVTPKNIFNLQEDAVGIVDKTAHGRYFTDPGDITGTEGQEGPSLEEQIAQAELQLKQQEVQIKQQELQIDAAKVKLEEQELALKARMHEDENEFKLAELNLEARQERAVKVGN
jgi:hypothetical protein